MLPNSLTNYHFKVKTYAPFVMLFMLMLEEQKISTWELSTFKQGIKLALYHFLKVLNS